MQVIKSVLCFFAAAVAFSKASIIPSGLSARSFGEAMVSNTSVNTTGLLYTGGEVWANFTNATLNTIVYEPTLNSSNVTLPELALISTSLNETESSSNLTFLVIAAEYESLQKTGFYFALSYPEETVVVTENITKGFQVANSTETYGRGGLIVSAEGVIYSAITYPNSAVGFVTESGKVVYFFEPSLPKILAPDSPLFSSKLFTPFNTSTVASNVTDVLITNYTSSSNKTRKGSSSAFIPEITVVAVNGTAEANKYSSEHKYSSAYTVFASYDLTFIDTSDLTSKTAIGAGFLSPVQASVLVSFAKAAGVNSLDPFFKALV